MFTRAVGEGWLTWLGLQLVVTGEGGRSLKGRGREMEREDGRELELCLEGRDSPRFFFYFYSTPYPVLGNPDVRNFDDRLRSLKAVCVRRELLQMTGLARSRT